jgi:hypothetical protein
MTGVGIDSPSTSPLTPYAEAEAWFSSLLGP